MIEEIFEFRRQARGPRNYMALGVVLTVIFLGCTQGWGLWAALLCGPFLAIVLVRLTLNEAQGFRLSDKGIDWCDGIVGRSLDWNEVNAVTIGGDGSGGADCRLHVDGGETVPLPASSAFSPERLALEFRQRGIPVWRPAGERLAVGVAQLQ